MKDPLLLSPLQFCGKDSLTDVLKAGRSSPAKAAQLPWTRRLNMVSCFESSGLFHLA